MLERKGSISSIRLGELQPLIEPNSRRERHYYRVFARRFKMIHAIAKIE